MLEPLRHRDGIKHAVLYWMLLLRLDHWFHKKRNMGYLEVRNPQKQGAVLIWSTRYIHLASETELQNISMGNIPGIWRCLCNYTS